MGRTILQPLHQRALVLFINLALFYIVFVLASEKVIPTGGLESVWLLSASALWFLTLLSSPWFLPPRDGIANAIGAAAILVTIDLAPAAHFAARLETLRWVGVVYCIGIVLLSTTALVLHDKNLNSRGGRLSFRLVGTFGVGEILYTIPAAISITGAYQTDFAAMAWLLFLWVTFAVARPVERVLSAWEQWREEGKSPFENNVVGLISRIDDPNIIRVRLLREGKWKPGSLHVAALADKEQHYVVALFTQTQGLEMIGTGICVAALQERVSAQAGQVLLSREADRAVEFIEKLSGTKDAELVGFVVENSSIGTIRFEIAHTASLEEGNVVFGRVNGHGVFYQILDAETTEESFDQNPRGTQIVRAAQIGCYDPAEALPSMLGYQR